jgi:hypothetical protein
MLQLSSLGSHMSFPPPLFPSSPIAGISASCVPHAPPTCCVSTGHRVACPAHLPRNSAVVVAYLRLTRDDNESGRVITRPLVKGLWVEIRTYPYISGFEGVSGTRRVYHFTYKNHIKIISLISKTQYTYIQN